MIRDGSNLFGKEAFVAKGMVFSMKDKLRDYIDLIFADAPDCKRTRELKEEFYSNICDKYDDLIQEGKSESAAYNISVAGVGDISDLIDSIKRENGGYMESGFEKAANEPVFTAEEKAEIEKYRARSGIMTSIAVALYILCWVPLVLLSTLSDFGGNADAWSTVGLVIMMLMIAAATGLLVLKSAFKPLCLKGERDLDDDDDSREKKSKNPILNTITGALWVLTVLAYLLLGFSFGLWHPGWMIFLISTAIENIIEAIFEILGKKYL